MMGGIGQCCGNYLRESNWFFLSPKFNFNYQLHHKQQLQQNYRDQQVIDFYVLPDLTFDPNLPNTYFNHNFNLQLLEMVWWLQLITVTNIAITPRQQLMATYTNNTNFGTGWEESWRAWRRRTFRLILLQTPRLLPLQYCHLHPHYLKCRAPENQRSKFT